MAEPMKWAPGDVVRLKSGGPNMTVKLESLLDKERLVPCQWFDGVILYEGKFAPGSLTAIETNDNSESDFVLPPNK
jgi:uncharacterized protein YodC (DUF2158 family)